MEIECLRAVEFFSHMCQEKLHEEVERWQLRGAVINCFVPDKAPVSKGLMGSMFLTCTAMNMPLLAHMRKYLVCKLPDIFKEGEVRFIELIILTFFFSDTEH